MDKVRRYLTICLMLAMASICLIGDELSDKQKQLQNVQSQLQAAEAKRKETETLKKKTDTDIQRTASLKRIADEKLSKLNKERAIKADSLTVVRDRISNVESELNYTKRLSNLEMEMLIRIRKSYQPTYNDHRDIRYMSDLLRHTSMKILSLQGFKTVLAQEQFLRSREVAEVSSKVSEETKVKLEHERKIQNLQSQSSKLSKEQKKLQDQIAKLKKDAAALEGLIKKLTSTPSSNQPATYKFTGKKISWPVRGKIIRSFGQETRAYGTSVTSNGIDIAVPEGTAVVAADDGVVVFADRYGGQGNLVIIDHKNGFFTVYAYNSSIVVSTGAKVKRGQTIARSGSSGSASEPSVHFELRKDGKSINPLPYLE